jgi:RNA polymerase sigma-70 factor (ECF subfamily)
VHELVDRSVKGDVEAFGSLYDLLCEDVYRYFYYQVGSSQDAEDLVSRTFLRAWRAIGSFRWRGKPFEAWLFTVARNQLIDFRRERRRGEAELEADYIDAKPGPEAIALANFEAAATRQALLRLTADQREVLVLRFYLNHDSREIAQIMGKGEGTVRGLQLRALRALRRHLTDE